MDLWQKTRHLRRSASPSLPSRRCCLHYFARQNSWRAFSEFFSTSSIDEENQVGRSGFVSRFWLQSSSDILPYWSTFRSSRWTFLMCLIAQRNWHLWGPDWSPGLKRHFSQGIHLGILVALSCFSNHWWLEPCNKTLPCLRETPIDSLSAQSNLRICHFSKILKASLY